MRFSARFAIALGLVLLAPAVSPAAAADVEAVLASPDRLLVDTARDLSRKPVDVIRFAGIRPGARILDLYAGGGYYAELFARLVEPGGDVIAHNNPAFLKFSADELAERNYGKRLPNVRTMVAENNQLKLVPSSFDLIWWSLGYHDLALDEPGWPRLDADKLRAELFAGLKPGGHLIIIDHRANPGEDGMIPGAPLHRVDPAKVIAELTAAGFALEATSDLLANPADDRKSSVFDRAIRGQTDRFIFKFRKPAA